MRGKSVGLLGTTIAEPPCRDADAELIADLVKGEGLSWHTGLLTDEELKWWEESLLLLVIVMALGWMFLLFIVFWPWSAWGRRGCSEVIIAGVHHGSG